MTIKRLVAIFFVFSACSSDTPKDLLARAEAAAQKQAHADVIATADKALQDADIILSAKSMLLNPDWVEGVRIGRELPLYASADANIAYTEEPLP